MELEDCLHYPGEMVSLKHCNAAHKKAVDANLTQQQSKCVACIRIVGAPTTSVSDKNPPKRTCRRCAEAKTLSQFPRSKKCKEGREWVCSRCRAKHSAENKDVSPLPGIDYTEIRIRFSGDDKKILNTLEAVAHKERRTLVAEILHVLEIFTAHAKVEGG